jgi:hypothetical protein
VDDLYDLGLDSLSNSSLSDNSDDDEPIDKKKNVNKDEKKPQLQQLPVLSGVMLNKEPIKSP